MTSIEEIKAWQNALKQLLKRRNISYADLAKRLRMSESGVKKLFSSSDLSLRRLSEICRALGISVSDFLSTADSSAFRDVEFTDAQQELLLKDVECFELYWKLVFERLSQARAQEALALTRDRINKSLRKLENAGLLRTKDGKVTQIAKLGLIRSFGDGPFIRKIYREFSRSLLDEFTLPGSEANRLYVFRYIKLRKSTYLEFLDEIRELERQFAKRGVREMALYPDEVGHVRWLTAVDDRSCVPDRDKVTTGPRP